MPNYYTVTPTSHVQTECSHPRRMQLVLTDRSDCALCGSRKLAGATRWEYLKPAALDYYLHGQDWREEAMKAEAYA